MVHNGEHKCSIDEKTISEDAHANPNVAHTHLSTVHEEVSYFLLRHIRTNICFFPISHISCGYKIK